MYKDLKEGVIDGVLTDLITAAYQLDQIKDNDLRISHVIQKPVHYKLAFVPRRAGSQALMSNECFRNRLYNPSRLSRELMLKYIKPLKVSVCLTEDWKATLPNNDNYSDDDV